MASLASAWPPLALVFPTPRPRGKTGYLQPAAKPLHRAPAGRHGVAEQEYQDAPLLNQPPQHRAARWLWGPARVEPEGQSWLSISSSHCPAPSFGTPWLPKSHFNVEGISQVTGKKKTRKRKQKSVSEPLSTYFCRNQRLQLCLSQTAQAKRDRRGEKAIRELPLKEERKPSVLHRRRGCVARCCGSHSNV